MDFSGFQPTTSWRQSGGEWSGPCPVSGAGDDESVGGPGSAAYFAAGAYPGIPVEAAGELLYRFTGPGDGEVAPAVQAVAVDPSGRRPADGLAMLGPGHARVGGPGHETAVCSWI